MDSARVWYNGVIDFLSRRSELVIMLSEAHVPCRIPPSLVTLSPLLLSTRKSIPACGVDTNLRYVSFPPRWIVSSTDTEDPIRTKLRKDNEAPIEMKSNTDNALPRRASPKT